MQLNRFTKQNFVIKFQSVGFLFYIVLRFTTTNMACCSIDLTLTNFVVFGVLIITAKKLIALYKKWQMDKMLEKWTQSSKSTNKVILHAMFRCKTLPSISPFVLKVETYLKMAGIPYELDFQDTMGPKGKTPWISYKGTHVADSHFCIQYLNKKFDVNLNKDSNKEKLAVARACRVLLEEHFTWGRAQYRWIENPSSILQVSKPPTPFKFAMSFISSNIRGRMDENGIGKHTPTEIYQIMEQDLHIVCSLLGNQPFFGGDSPCEDDAAIFGSIAQVVWGMPGSSFEKLLDDKLRNLNEYCYRMKERFYPDWEKCLDKVC